jgi:hypothetical protein
MMIRRVVLYTLGSILLVPVLTRGGETVPFSRCSRPSDQYGPRYEVMTGMYRSRGVSPGGGKFMTITPKDWAAPVSLNVTDEVFDIAGTLALGTPIILVGYVSNSASGAQPPYSCIELAY